MEKIRMLKIAAIGVAVVLARPSDAASSRMYVQRGLVAQYDGINNAGTGEHNTAATTWKNLAGDELLDGTLAAQLTWNGANGWTVSGDCKPVTVGSGLAQVISQTNCTIEVACKPSFVNKRFVYFGQYDGSSYYRAISLENTVAGKYRLFRTRTASSASDYNWTDITPAGSANTFVSFAFVLANKYPKLYQNGGQVATANKDWGDASADATSVIGGEPWDSSNRTGSNFDSTYKVAFNGTYHAFRLYNRTLSADEIAWNEGLDAVRFNGADAAATLGAGYSYDVATDTLSVNVIAMASNGGMVALDGGSDGASASKSVAAGDDTVLSATADRGYVFDRWTGDTSAITAGSILTPEITVTADAPATLVATFRRNGDAADGLKFDLSFTGDKTADGLTFSESNSEVKHGYITADVALPVLPTVTNRVVNCLYFQQPDGADADSIFRQDVRKANTAVTGNVATVFCRFRWDEPTVSTKECYPTIVLNGYTSWNNNNGVRADGFAVRLRCGAGETKGYPIMLVSKVAPGYQNPGITTTGTAYVNAGRWVDMFVSVYPSPTNPSLSNADIWYCEVPSWNANGYFNASAINHRHFGDGCGITNIVTTTEELRFGCEPNPNVAAVTGDAGKCFRGAIACAKGWDRVLSENEMWTVMADLGGVQSFTDLSTRAGCTFETGNINSDAYREGRNGTAISFIGDNTHRWRSMTTTYNTNTLIWNAPKETRECWPTYPVVYKTKIANLKEEGNTHPIHLECNGVKVWPTDAASKEVTKGEEIEVAIPAEYTLPGLNELKWVYDTEVPSNWMIFASHSLRIFPPPRGLMILVR